MAVGQEGGGCRGLGGGSLWLNVECPAQLFLHTPCGNLTNKMLHILLQQDHWLRFYCEMIHLWKPGAPQDQPKAHAGHYAQHICSHHRQQLTASAAGVTARTADRQRILIPVFQICCPHATSRKVDFATPSSSAELRGSPSQKATPAPPDSTQAHLVEFVIVCCFVRVVGLVLSVRKIL